MLNSEADANVSSVCGTEHPSQMLERFRKRRSETRVEFRPAKPQDKTAETDVSNDCKTHLLALRACKPCWLTSTLTSVFVAHSVRAACLFSFMRLEHALHRIDRDGQYGFSGTPGDVHRDKLPG